jgi:alpha-L-arabinofuranosidase
VNRHEKEPIHATVAIQNARVGKQATSFEINGSSPKVENSFSEPDNVKISQKEIGGMGEKFDYDFPAHSVTLLKLSMT